ncbi:hypothetical protein NM688_g7213 [Phlebia brevispora]|uniref:Uncharacterized protein n=1 Tax=Phlebia brevispora TaxID=194682 RepID=A0ACC1S7Y9_9APHY|nr:hypothetical protein NM688_g7213 [Phlebia brevispora]
MFDWSKKFFALPMETKMLAPHPASGMHHRAIPPPASEKAKALDVKESFESGREDDPAMPNIWPPVEIIPGVRETCLAFYWTCRGISLDTLRAAALSSNLPEEYFVQYHSPAENQLRVLHHPRPVIIVGFRHALLIRVACYSVLAQKLRKEEVMRIGAHSDFGTIALLMQDSVGGLEADKIPSECAANRVYDDALMNNTTWSTIHRVRAPPNLTTADRMAPDRYSLRYVIPRSCKFSNSLTVEQDFSTLIDCIPYTYSGERSKKYEPVTYASEINRRKRIARAEGHRLTNRQYTTAHVYHVFNPRKISLLEGASMYKEECEHGNQWLIIRVDMGTFSGSESDSGITPIGLNCKLSSVVAFYEYIITFKYEYELLWQRKRTAATWLFIANRITMLACAILRPLPIGYQTPAVLQSSSAILFGFCDKLYFNNFGWHAFLLSSASINTYVLLSVFAALRVFALLDRAYLAAGCVLLLGLFQTGAGLYETKQSVYYFVDDPIFGPTCSPESKLSALQAFYRKSCANRLMNATNLFAVNLTTMLTAIAANIVAIMATWRKTYRHVRQAASIGVRADIGATLIQYGTLHFVIISALFVASIIIFVSPSLTGFTGAIGAFIAIFPNIVISRFLIDLHQADSPATSDLSRFSSFSAPNFRMSSQLPAILGNLGEPLQLNSGEFDSGEEESVDADVNGACPNSDQLCENKDVEILDPTCGKVDEVRI